MKIKFRKTIPRRIKLRFFNTSKFPRRSKAEWKLIQRNPFGDSDKDGVKNFFDCKPLNRKKQGWAHQGIKFNRERSTYIRMMTPDKFLRTTRLEVYNREKAHSPTVYEDKKKNEITQKAHAELLNMYSSDENYEKKVISQDNVDKLKRTLKSKAKVDIPYLEYDEQGRPTGHEGRHRAAAAKQMGVKLIPVTIARKLKEPRDWKERRKEWKYKGTKHDWRNELENVDEVISSKSADIPLKEQRTYGEEKPETLQHFKGPQRMIKESDSARVLRQRRGLNKIRTIDAAEFKKKFEEKHGEQLDWNPDRLKSALERNEDDAYPEVSFETSNVSDGRHRISAAALRNQKIDVAYPDWQEETLRELKEELKD